jgi:hypothetical protein
MIVTRGSRGPLRALHAAAASEDAPRSPAFRLPPHSLRRARLEFVLVGAQVWRGAVAVTRGSGGPRPDLHAAAASEVHANHRRCAFSPTFFGARATRLCLLVRRFGVARWLSPERAAGRGGICTQLRHRRTRSNHRRRLFFPVDCGECIALVGAQVTTRISSTVLTFALTYVVGDGNGVRLPFSTGLWLRGQQPANLHGRVWSVLPLATPHA